MESHRRCPDRPCRACARHPDPITCALMRAYRETSDSLFREKCLALHQRLVHAVVRSIKVHSSLRTKLEYDDLLSWGNIGLVIAFDTWDVSRGFCFSTHAMLVIKRRILREIACAFPLRIPAGAYEEVGHILRAQDRLAQLLGREPTLEEVAECLNLRVEKVRLMLVHITCLELDGRVESDREDSLAWHEVLPDPTTPDPLERAIRHEQWQVVAPLLDTLPPREKDIMLRRHGFMGEAETLESIGGRYRISRERVRQILAKQYKELRPQLLRTT